MEYIIYNNIASRELAALAPLVQRRIRKSLRRVADNIHVQGIARCLHNTRVRGLKKVESGNFRAVFMVHPDNLEVVAVGHRKSVYRCLPATEGQH